MRTVQVGDALHLVRRPVEVDPIASYEEIGIRSFGRGFFPKPPILGSELGSKRMFEINEGDLVLNIVFAWEGAVALAGPREHKKCASHRFPTYVADPEVCDPRYLHYFFMTPRGLAALGQASPGSAGRNRTLNLRALEAVQVELPPVGEQQRIADRVEALVERIEVARKLRLTASNMSTQLIGSMLDQLDRSGPRVPIGEALTLSPDPVPVELDRTYDTVGIYSFGRGLFARPPITGAETKYKTLFRLHRDQLVLSRLNGWEGAVTVVRDQWDGRLVSQEYPTFDVDPDGIDIRYLDLICRWDRFWESLVPRGSMVRRKRVHPDRLLAVKIPLPRLEEQQRIAGIAPTINQLDEATRSFDATFKALEPSIIGAAIDGRL
jgi:type I restriction enzyme S subunit